MCELLYKMILTSSVNSANPFNHHEAHRPMKECNFLYLSLFVKIISPRRSFYSNISSFERKCFSIILGICARARTSWTGREKETEFPMSDCVIVTRVLTRPFCALSRAARFNEQALHYGKYGICTNESMRRGVGPLFERNDREISMFVIYAYKGFGTGDTSVMYEKRGETGVEWCYDKYRSNASRKSSLRELNKYNGAAAN